MAKRSVAPQADAGPTVRNMNSSGIPFTRLATRARRTVRMFAPRVVSLFLLVAISAAGCRSLDRPASVSFASVIISKKYSIAQIQRATVTVFERNGYRNVPRPDNPLVFEREATRGEQISYAGIWGAQQGEKVIIQVRVKIEDRNAGTCWLGCKAYAVCNPDQPFYATTTALMHFQSGPFQKLLNDVKGTVQRPVISPQS